jgi:hypothetical protein
MFGPTYEEESRRQEESDLAEANQQMAPGSYLCREKCKLEDELEMLFTRIASIHAKEVRALMRSDYRKDLRLLAELAEARRRRDDIRQELKEHIERHRCRRSSVADLSRISLTRGQDAAGSI